MSTETSIQTGPLPETKPSTLAGWLKKPEYLQRFKEVLKDQAPQFVSSLINVGNALGRDVEPRSVIGSAMVAATLNLPIDKNLGFAWIVPYKNKGIRMAQFQMGWKGYVQLALRSSQYERMNAVAINKEAFLGYDDLGEPIVDWAKFDPTQAVSAYFFGWRMVNGFTKKVVWSKDEVIQHARKFSQSYRSGEGVWASNFDAMALKTVVANSLRKWAIMSIQMQRAFQVDQAIVPDIDAEAEFVDSSEDFDAPVRPTLASEHPAVKRQEIQRAEKAVGAAKAEAREKKEEAPPAKPESDEKPEPPQESLPSETEPPAAPETLEVHPAKKPARQVPAPPKADERPVPKPDAEEDLLPMTRTESSESEDRPTVMTANQAQLKQLIESEGLTFEQFLGWASFCSFFAGPKGPKPVSWETVKDDTAKTIASFGKRATEAIGKWIASKNEKSKNKA